MKPRALVRRNLAATPHSATAAGRMTIAATAFTVRATTQWGTEGTTRAGKSRSAIVRITGAAIRAPV